MQQTQISSVEPTTMQQGIKYKVTSVSNGAVVGHFLDNIYYEPHGSDNRLGHIDNQGNFVYYMVNPGGSPSIRGNYSAGKITRTDGVSFLVELDT